MRKILLFMLLVAIVSFCSGCESYCRRCEELEEEISAYEDKISALYQELEDTKIEMGVALDAARGYLYGVEDNLSGYFFEADPDAALKTAIEGQEYLDNLDF